MTISTIMLFRQLFDTTSSTYTYILGCNDSQDAIIIDPVFEQHARDTALLRELGLNVKYTVDTHVHADHVTGSWLMKESEGAKITLSGNYGATSIDVELEDGMVLAFGNCSITAHSTPGHTDGCFTFVTSEQTMAFTGDCLLIRGAGRTDFQSGDVHTLWGSIREKIFSLPGECLLYPGHDYMGRTVSTVTEEKTFNPRIGGDAREEDFAGYMNNLGLPHPKQLDIALPANLRAGKPDALMSKPTWAPINVTFAGIPEVEPDWVARHLDEICVLDVRSEAEYSGDLGYIEGSILIPLDQLRDRIREVPTDKPVVAMCQSGKRSSMATQILKASGIEDVANVPGGLIHWSRLALPRLHYPDWYRPDE
jgi:glyoxylase-like metal-dependent hydrolase (beta-lactamase superfamily II)/rhodanese-related sulfurtransferase